MTRLKSKRNQSLLTSSPTVFLKAPHLSEKPLDPQAGGYAYLRTSRHEGLLKEQLMKDASFHHQKVTMKTTGCWGWVFGFLFALTVPPLARSQDAALTASRTATTNLVQEAALRAAAPQWQAKSRLC